LPGKFVALCSCLFPEGLPNVNLGTLGTGADGGIAANVIRLQLTLFQQLQDVQCQLPLLA